MHPDLLDILRAAVAGAPAGFDLAALPPHIRGHTLASGLGPLLFHMVKNGLAKVPRELENELLGSELTSRVLTAEHLDALEEILRMLGAAAEHIALLKGISISQTHYLAPHLRPMGDIDLLVPPELHAAAENVLRRLGYRQRSDYPEDFYRTFHHSMPFYHPRRRVWVEIHRALFPPASRVAQDCVFQAENTWKQTVPHGFRGLRCRRLRDELQLVYTCAHWAEELNPSRGLVPLLDMLLLLTREDLPLRWDDLLTWTRDSASLKQLAFVALYLQRRGLVSLSDRVNRDLVEASTNMNFLTRSILEWIVGNFLARGRPFGTLLTRDNTRIVWRTLLDLKKPWRNLISLPWNLVLPPGESRRWRFDYQMGRVTSALGLRKRDTR